MRRREPEPVLPIGETSGLPAHLAEWSPDEWREPVEGRSVFGQMWDSYRRWQKARDDWAAARDLDPLQFAGTLRMVQAVTEASLDRGGRTFQDDVKTR